MRSEEIKNKTALAVSFSVHKNTSSAVIVLLHSVEVKVNRSCLGQVI